MSGDKRGRAAPAAKGAGAVSKPTPKAASARSEPQAKPGGKTTVSKVRPAAKKPTPHNGVEYRPTKFGAAVVEKMASYRISHEEIAAVLEIDPKTLRKHYPRQLEAAAAQLEARLHETLSIQAFGAPAEYYPKGHENAGALARKEQPRYAPAAFFLLKHAEGMKEKAHRRAVELAEQAHRHALEVADAENRRQIEERSAVLDLSDATPEELDVLERFFRRQIQRPPADG